MEVYVVHYMMRKGLGPTWIEKSSTIGLDDCDAEMEEWEKMAFAENEVERELTTNEDYPIYGKTWYLTETLKS